MRSGAILVIVLSLGLSSPAAATSVFKDFDQVWAARDATYQSQHAELQARVQRSGQAISQSLNPIAAIDADRMKTAVTDPDLYAYIAAERDLGELDARAALLRELRERMRSKPSAAMTEAWLQGKMDEIQSESRAVEAAASLLHAAATTSPMTEDMLLSVERVVMKQGALAGRTAELALLHQNLSTLYQAKTESDQRRRAAWAAFGAAMQRMGQQQQRQNWSATCMAMGPTMTTCNGN